MLEMAGAGEVKTLAAGQEAIDSLKSGDIPDLIILDHNMPGMTGAQTLALIRDLHQDLPILMASGQPNIQEWVASGQKNVAIISKPFSLEELQEKLVELGILADRGAPEDRAITQRVGEK
jgi:CheY-like chemotaxis protein